MAETQEVKSQPLINTFMKRFQLAGAGIAFVALLAVSVWYLGGINGSSPSSLTSMLSGPKITRAGDNAFGSLNNVQASSGGMGGESSNLSAQVPSSTDMPMGMGSGGDAKLIAPQQPVNFRYVYTGEELNLVQDKVDVLKRVKNEDSGNLNSFINRISLGLVDLGSFGNSKLQHFSFAEDKDLGYMVNVSLTEGSININENWAKWDKMLSTCPVSSSRPVSCEPRRIQLTDIPADQVLIDAANAFLIEHNIPRENYGEPYVNNDWRVNYERTPDKTNYWIPDVMNVVYPLVLEGQAVYDESGNRNGLNVSVRVSPEVRVSSVWELTTQNYQSSSYTAETDVKRIMGLAEKGGFRNYYYSEPSAKTVDIELGTPQISFVKLWNYNGSTSEELLVPALIFPVTKEPAANEVGPYYWYRKNVVIPLVKEILDNENAPGDVRIMPASGAAEPAVLKKAQ